MVKLGGQEVGGRRVELLEIELRRSASQISRLSEALAETCDELERRASFDPLTGVLSRPALLACDDGRRIAATWTAQPRA